jgi:hypothetical protein
MQVTDMTMDYLEELTIWLYFCPYVFMAGVLMFNLGFWVKLG